MTQEERDKRNRYYWLIQVLVANMGDHLSTANYTVRKLSLFRQYPDRLIEEDAQDEIEELITDACRIIGINRKVVENVAKEHQKKTEEMLDANPGLYDSIRKDIEKFNQEKDES